jgi:hypothetical protein
MCSSASGMQTCQGSLVPKPRDRRKSRGLGCEASISLGIQRYTRDRAAFMGWRTTLRIWWAMSGCSTARCSVVRCSAVQYDAVWCSAVQYSTWRTIDRVRLSISHRQGITHIYITCIGYLRVHAVWSGHKAEKIQGGNSKLPSLSLILFFSSKVAPPIPYIQKLSEDGRLLLATLQTLQRPSVHLDKVLVQLQAATLQRKERLLMLYYGHAYKDK